MARPRDPSDLKRILPKVPFENCPIRASLGVLGHKWALLALRDVSFLRTATFGQILRNNPGMTPRVLSMRLRELQDEEILERIVNPEDRRDIRYRLTAKGLDVVPILAAIIQFGIRHHADVVFEDEKPRRLQQVFPDEHEVLLGRLQEYADAGRARR